MAKLESKKHLKKKPDLSIRKHQKRKSQTKKGGKTKSVFGKTISVFGQQFNLGSGKQRKKKLLRGKHQKKNIVGKKPLNPKPENDKQQKTPVVNGKQQKTESTVGKGPKTTSVNRKQPNKQEVKKNFNQARGVLTPKRNVIVNHSSEYRDELLRRKYTEVTFEDKNKNSEDLDKTQLLNADTVKQAVSGIRRLATVAQEEREKQETKNLLDDSSAGEDALIFLQVTMCKLPVTTANQHLVKSNTINVRLPNSVTNDDTEVILITRDLERGIKPDHENTLHHYLDLLQQHGVTSLVNEVIPLRQLKVEYREHEARRHLANRADVVLCDDTVMRFIPKFLGKHFYKKKKNPVQVNLKAKNLQHELSRALSVSPLTFVMGGNCALMKVGRLSHTDEQIAENIMAVAAKLADYLPGGWKNVQNLGIKLEKSKSLPVYLNMSSLNDIEPIPPKPVGYKETVSGMLTTLPGRIVTVFPGGEVSILKMQKDAVDRLPEGEQAEANQVIDKWADRDKKTLEKKKKREKNRLKRVKKEEKLKRTKLQEKRERKALRKAAKAAAEPTMEGKAETVEETKTDETEKEKVKVTQENDSITEESQKENVIVETMEVTQEKASITEESQDDDLVVEAVGLTEEKTSNTRASEEEKTSETVEPVKKKKKKANSDESVEKTAEETPEPAKKKKKAESTEETPKETRKTKKMKKAVTEDSKSDETGEKTMEEPAKKKKKKAATEESKEDTSEKTMKPLKKKKKKKAATGGSQKEKTNEPVKKKKVKKSEKTMQIAPHKDSTTKSAQKSGKKSKANMKKLSKNSGSDSDEDNLEAQELAYLRKRSQHIETEKGTPAEDDNEVDDDSDGWVDMSDEDEEEMFQ